MLKKLKQALLDMDQKDAEHQRCVDSGLWQTQT
jgi:hypothetical protein